MCNNSTPVHDILEISMYTYTLHPFHYILTNSYVYNLSTWYDTLTNHICTIYFLGTISRQASVCMYLHLHVCERCHFHNHVSVFEIKMLLYLFLKWIYVFAEPHIVFISITLNDKIKHVFEFINISRFR